jgi:hypothetical protein
MARRVPVLATDVGGVAELVGGGAGVLVPPDDPVALARALGELSAAPGRLRELGEAGRRRVEDQFAVDRIADRLLALFAETPGASTRPGRPRAPDAPTPRGRPGNPYYLRMARRRARIEARR